MFQMFPLLVSNLLKELRNWFQFNHPLVIWWNQALRLLKWRGDPYHICRLSVSYKCSFLDLFHALLVIMQRLSSLEVWQCHKWLHLCNGLLDKVKEFLWTGLCDGTKQEPILQLLPFPIGLILKWFLWPAKLG